MWSHFMALAYYAPDDEDDAAHHEKHPEDLPAGGGEAAFQQRAAGPPEEPGDELDEEPQQWHYEDQENYTDEDLEQVPHTLEDYSPFFSSFSFRRISCRTQTASSTVL